MSAADYAPYVCTAVAPWAPEKGEPVVHPDAEMSQIDAVSARWICWHCKHRWTERRRP